MSKEKLNIYQKLSVVQAELKAPKTQYNSFGKYYYRNLEDILEGLKPLLKKVGAIVLIEDTIDLIGDRYYVKAEAKFIDVESGEHISNTAYARESLEKRGMDLSQLTGATSSYARKYALNGLFAIDDTRDADSMDNKTPTQRQAPTQRQQPRPVANKQGGQYICSECKGAMPENVYQYSMTKYKKPVCYECQQAMK